MLLWLPLAGVGAVVVVGVGVFIRSMFRGWQ